MKLASRIRKFTALPTLIGLCCSLANCQDYGQLELVDQLPGDLREVSGIQLMDDPNTIWMVNDSGNRPEVFSWDISQSQIKNSLKIDGLKNVDWEDLATDGDSILFIGDFGNNSNKRKDLVIYHLKIDPSAAESSELVATTLFSFENQDKFPPKQDKRKFDVEGFFYRNGYFYLFTRHRDKAFDGGSHIYRLKAGEGSYQAQKLGKFKSCKDSRDCQITAADYDPVKDRIALLSYNKLWILDSIDWDSMEHYRTKLYKLGHRSQKESVSFESGDCLLIADERVRIQGPNLYRFCLEAGTDPE